MADRRRFGRRRCRVHGWIKVNRRPRVPCTMTDYSEGGARLIHEAQFNLPSRFKLCFDGFASMIPCEVRHEGAGAVGVEFAAARGYPLGRNVQELLGWLAK